MHEPFTALFPNPGLNLHHCSGLDQVHALDDNTPVPILAALEALQGLRANSVERSTNCNADVDTSSVYLCGFALLPTATSSANGSTSGMSVTGMGVSGSVNGLWVKTEALLGSAVDYGVSPPALYAPPYCDAIPKPSIALPRNLASSIDGL